MEGLRKILLEEIPLWIKMMFMEKRLMRIEPNKMVE